MSAAKPVEAVLGPLPEPVPPAPPPLPPLPRPAPPRPERKPLHLEELIGLKVLSWAGIIILLVGAALLAKYVSVGVLGRVIAEVAGGLVLLGAGEVFSRKAYRTLSRVCTGGGLALEYFAAFSAGVLYKLAPMPATWIFMAIITGIAILLAVRYASVTIAIVSLVGGLAAPILIRPERDPGHTLFLYLLAVNAGVLILAYYKKWRLLNVLALMGTVVNFSIWLAGHYWHVDTAGERLGFALSYLTAFWGVFFLLGIVYHTLGRRAPSRLDLPVTVLNVVWYFSILYALLRTDHHLWLGPAAIVLGCVYLAHGLAIRRWAPRHALLCLLQVAESLGLFALAIPIALEGIWIPMAWAVQAVILVWIGCRLADWRVRAVGFLVHAASAASLMYFARELWRVEGMLVLSGRTATLAVVALAVALSVYMVRRLITPGKDEDTALTVAAGVAHAILMILVVVEIQRWYAQATAALGRFEIVPSTAYRHLKWKNGAFTAIGLAAYGLGAVTIAAVVRRALHQTVALAAFAGSLVALAISLGYLPDVHRLAGWNAVGATFAGVAGCLALSAVLSRYAGRPVRTGRRLAVTYELLALGVLLGLYFTEVVRASDGRMLPRFEGPSSFHVSLFAAALALYAGGLVLRGLWIRSLAHRVAGLACLAAASICLIVASTAGRVTCQVVLWHPRGVAYLLLIAAMALTVRMCGRLEKTSTERGAVAPLLSVFVHAVVLVCFTLEAVDFWDVRADTWFRDSQLQAWYARHATLSLGYALYAIALLVVGMLRRTALLRWLALVVLATTVVKVLAYDLSKLEALWRILSFLGLGFLLLAGSFFYHKYRHVLS